MKLTTLKLQTYIHQKVPERQGKDNHNIGRGTCNMKGLTFKTY